MISEFCEIVIQMLQFYLPTERILVDVSFRNCKLRLSDNIQRNDAS